MVVMGATLIIWIHHLCWIPELVGFNARATLERLGFIFIIINYIPKGYSGIVEANHSHSPTLPLISYPSIM